MDVSIIILNYNTKQLTLSAIESVYRSETGYRYEIILVDNASTDGTVEAVRKNYPEVRTIVSPTNVGFSRGNNTGIRQACGRYILLLNSDTIMQPDTLEIMVRFMDEHPNVGASGCKIILPDGQLDKACKRGFPTPSASFYYAFGFSKWFPNNPRFTQYQLSHLDSDQDYPVDSLVGAFMLVRREAIDQVGLLDEDFFMYGEDIDWCFRIKQAGRQIYYYPYTHIIHYKGASSSRKPFKIVYEFHRAMFLFHQKHYKQKYNFFINALVYTGITVKLIVAMIRNLIKR